MIETLEPFSKSELDVMEKMSNNKLYKNALLLRNELDNKTIDQKEIYLENLLKKGNIYFMNNGDRNKFKKAKKLNENQYSVITDIEEIQIEAKILSGMNRTLFSIE